MGKIHLVEYCWIREWEEEGREEKKDEGSGGVAVVGRGGRR